MGVAGSLIAKNGEICKVLVSHLPLAFEPHGVSIPDMYGVVGEDVGSNTAMCESQLDFTFNGRIFFWVKNFIKRERSSSTWGSILEKRARK